VLKLQHIDILIGGSPCQSFSFAGKRKGMSTKCEIEITKLEQYLELKEQGFEFEGQSYLFWEYMRILTDIRKYNPDVKFLLENVEMGNKWERVLSEAIGIYGVHINSALVSAQNRARIYWTNIRTKQVGLFGEVYSDIPQPEDKGIVLKDILESEVDEKYYLSDRLIKTLSNRPKGYQNLKPKELNEKASSIVATMFKMHSSDNYVIQLNPSKESGGKQPYQQNRVYHENGKLPALMTEQRGYIFAENALLIKEATKKGYTEIKPGECFDYENPKSKTRRGRKTESKSNSLMAQNMSFMKYTENYHIRKLTPLECSRLQTIPSWYVWNCSDTQAYRILGNGWTIDVIKHILSFL
jgi:DNA (cytosine-5)-methyltransferase 3A